MTASGAVFRNASTTQLGEFLKAARSYTEDVFSLYANQVEKTDFVVPSADGLNLPLWELGHIAWFQEHWILRNQQRLDGERCSPAPGLSDSRLAGADEFFDSSRVAHAARWHLPLPDRNSTRKYLDEVMQATLAQIEQTSALQTSENRDASYFYWLCAAHEFMHAEAFAYMAERLALPGIEAFRVKAAQTPGIAGFASFGEPPVRHRPKYTFDNEAGYLAAENQALGETSTLEVDMLPVSWAAFDAFRQSPAYSALQLKVPFKSNARPLISGDPNSAVSNITYWEAKAWCDWKGRRLPSEFEWQLGVGKVNGVWGQVWEWTSSSFAPFQGFTPHPYKDYSEPWFDGNHKVLKGGSVYTHSAMKHPSYRNFFLPQRSDVCTGFRSCR
jgi:gamma-glutamyl hercynylcysteine S-oxide synthase